MERFLASLSNELFKLRKRKKYLVFLIIGAVICVASALRVLIVNYITDGGVSREAILGGLMSSNLPFILLIFLPLMAVMAASDLFVGEQVDHTLRFSLMRPVGKGKLFFSKAAAVFLLCAFDLAVLYVVSTVAQVGLGGGTEGILTPGTYDSGKSMESNLVALMKAVGASAATPDYGYGDFSADMIEAGRHRGILFQNWTVNSMSDIASLHLKGVDCVTTDFSSFSQNKELLDYQDVTAAGLFGEEEPQPTDPDDPQGGSSSDVTDSPDTGVDTQALFAAMGIGMAAVLVLFRFSRKKRA